MAKERKFRVGSITPAIGCTHDSVSEIIKDESLNNELYCAAIEDIGSMAALILTTVRDAKEVLESIEDPSGVT